MFYELFMYLRFRANVIHSINIWSHHTQDQQKKQHNIFPVHEGLKAEQN